MHRLDIVGIDNTLILSRCGSLLLNGCHHILLILSPQSCTLRVEQIEIGIRDLRRQRAGQCHEHTLACSTLVSRCCNEELASPNTRFVSRCVPLLFPSDCDPIVLGRRCEEIAIILDNLVELSTLRSGHRCDGTRLDVRLARRVVVMTLGIKGQSRRNRHLAYSLASGHIDLQLAGLNRCALVGEIVDHQLNALGRKGISLLDRTNEYLRATSLARRYRGVDPRGQLATDSPLEVGLNNNAVHILLVVPQEIERLNGSRTIDITTLAIALEVDRSLVILSHIDIHRASQLHTCQLSDSLRFAIHRKRHLTHAIGIELVLIGNLDLDLLRACLTHQRELTCGINQREILCSRRGNRNLPRHIGVDRERYGLAALDNLLDQRREHGLHIRFGLGLGFATDRENRCGTHHHSGHKSKNLLFHKRLFFEIVLIEFCNLLFVCSVSGYIPSSRCRRSASSSLTHSKML